MSQYKYFKLVRMAFIAFAWASPAMMEASVQQNKIELPATHVEYEALRAGLFNVFREQPGLTLNEKAERSRLILELDTYAIQKLESVDVAYLVGTDDSSESLVSRTRDGTIANSFFLANLLKDAGQFAESAETMEYVVANSVKLFGENNWKTLEYKLKLGTAKWLMNASEGQLAKWNQANMASNHGLAAFRENDSTTARDLLSQAKSTLEELSLQNTMDYGEAVANLAEVVALTDSVVEVETAFQKALDVNDELFSNRSPTNANMRLSLAMFYSRNSMPQKAIDAIEQAEMIFKTVYGDKSVFLAQSLSFKGIQLLALKQYQEAQSQHLQAFKMLNELGQRNGQISLFVLDNEFTLLSSMAKHQDAADVAQLAIPVAEAVFGKDRVEAMEWLIRSGTANRASRNFDKAVEQLTAAKKFFESNEEFARDQRYVECLSGLAMTYYLMNQLDQAVEIAGQASELSKEVAGESSIFHLARAQNLASFLAQNKEHQKADAVFVRILPLLKDGLGEANIDYQKTVFDQALNLIQFEKTDAAIELLTYLRGIQENSIGPAHPDFSTTLQSLVDAYENKGSAELANKLKVELAKIKQDSDAKVDPDDRDNSNDNKQ